MTTNISKNKLQEMIERARIRVASEKAALNALNILNALNTLSEENIEKAATSKKSSESLQYNDEQQRFIHLVQEGNDAVLIGAAGTGKTTTMKGTISALLSAHIPVLTEKHKHLPIGTPGIVATSYTRRSVANLKRAMPADMTGNCITIHKLLEYQPFWESVFDPETGETRTKMEFKPARTAHKPLDPAIKIIILDEASTVSLELFKLLLAALPHPVQFIYLGDIQQLPPVFGSAILGYKGAELAQSTVELKTVYRQALESPIIRLAHRILNGNAIPAEEFPEWHFPNQLTLHPWKKRISADSALLTIAAFFKRAIDNKLYDPETDMILIPFNKACGTDELNKHIANHIARTAKRTTYEIIAGFNKLYLTEGDLVMYDREDAVVTAINHNGEYSGRHPQQASQHLDYWGHRQDTAIAMHEETEEELEHRINSLMHSAANEVTDKTNEASHVVTLVLKDSQEEVVLNTASELNSLIHGYSLTVHKSQGSEWRKVFLILHSSHNTMLQRELLYTAVTRPREELYVICEPDSFIKGVQNQRIKGETLAEKFEYFKGKIASST